MKNILKQLALCASCGIIDLVLFGLLLRMSLFKDITIYYYRILYLVMVITVISLALFIFHQCAMYYYRDSFMCLFFSIDPMVIERSYTIFSLADMTDHADTVYSAEDIKTQFIEGYIEGDNESQKRIDEQVSIGNVAKVSGGYQIKKGKSLVEFFRFIEVIFPVPDKNSIYPNGQ